MTIGKNLFSATLFFAVFTLGSCSQDDEDDLNGHEYVDLDLPSGTLWATCNVGANTPEAPGYYFAWGETTPKESYSWSNYKWCNGSSESLTKYYSADGQKQLAPKDDAATANWGSGWCTPSPEQLQELFEYTKTDRTANGMSFSRNGKILFIPYAGYKDEKRVNYSREALCVWSNSIDLRERYDYNANAVCLYPPAGVTTKSRSYGLSVRPVRRQNK